MSKKIYEFDPFVMFIRALEEENKARKTQISLASNNLMARNMRPCKEEWEKLGFVFTDIPGDDELYEAKLPEGWSTVPSEYPKKNNILDENKNIRGSIFYNISYYGIIAEMQLYRRYNIVVEHDNNLIEVYFGNKEEKLFVAGQIRNSDYSHDNDGNKAYFKEEDRLKKLAEDFANENYPDWKNFNAYWENDMKLIYKPNKDKK